MSCAALSPAVLLVLIGGVIAALGVIVTLIACLPRHRAPPRGEADDDSITGIGA